MLLEIDTLTFVFFYKFDFFLRAQSVFTTFYVVYSTFFSRFSEFNVVTGIVFFLSPPCLLFIKGQRRFSPPGVTLAHLLKASVGQADIQRFEPHLRS